MRGGKNAIVSWDAPVHGGHASYRLKLVGLTYPGKIQAILLEESDLPYTLKDLIPGASYQVQAFTDFDLKESVAYTSRNFTTSK